MDISRKLQFYHGSLLFILLLSQISYAAKAETKYFCFPQTYSTCHYGPHINTTGDYVGAQCNQITDRIYCSNESGQVCKSMGYATVSCRDYKKCRNFYSSYTKSLPGLLNVTLTCPQTDQYVDILKAAYVLPKDRINSNKVGEQPNCTDTRIGYCYKSNCGCFIPVESDVCEETVSLSPTHAWQETCASSRGNCTLAASWKYMAACKGLTYSCNSDYDYRSCYAIWIKFTYQCRTNDPATLDLPTSTCPQSDIITIDPDVINTSKSLVSSVLLCVVVAVITLSQWLG